jgi:hypothetical protein
MTNKTIIIAVIAVLVIVGGVFLLFKSRTPAVVDLNAFTNEENELTAFEADLALFVDDETVLSELDQTFSDIAETTGGVSASEALDITSISQEANLIDLSGDLTDSANDDTALQELEQILGEILQ